MSERSRLAWFAAVAFVAVFGIGSLAIWTWETLHGPGWWGLDVTAVAAARRLIAGEPLYVTAAGAWGGMYLYPPLAAGLALPLTVRDP